MGGAACETCHPAESAAWKGSHHDLAMQRADSTTILGDFSNATFTKDNVTSVFFRSDGRYVVRTEGADGRLAPYSIAYTFGVAPLQQYLVGFPDGRLQALSLLWDTRPAIEGGQRWFHLYDETVRPGDALFWTRPSQNWNFTCAECHSTNLRKNYDPTKDRFATTWTDIDVACESCHGPGAKHLAWAIRERRPGEPESDSSRGLAIRFEKDPRTPWTFAEGQTIARRAAPPARDPLETCALCHSRRSQIWRDVYPHEPLAQSHRVALLDAGLYHADGQIEGEVYEYGSFLQSKMHAAGVTCTNCHDPHTARLRAEGNAVCAPCHEPSRYDDPVHHGHRKESAGGACISCHMIERTYMGIDRRRDHSFRVPRPDLSRRIGTPNACNDCHTDRGADWAERAIVRWRGGAWRPGRHPGETIHALRTGAADAAARLLGILGDETQPAIVRATAVSLAAPYYTDHLRVALARAVRDPDALVRRAAAGVLGSLPVATRLELVPALLSDSIRTVRLEALSSLFGDPHANLPAPLREVADPVVAEYRFVQAFNADRAEAWANVAVLESWLGRHDLAEASNRNAIGRDSSYAPAWINLADLVAFAGRAPEADALLGQALVRDSTQAQTQYAIGLSLLRRGRFADGLVRLERACALEPDNPGYAYVRAIALYDLGRKDGAIEVLRAVHTRRPGDRDFLTSLVRYESEQGNRDAALRWAKALLRLDPTDRPTRALVAGLGKAP